MSDWIVNKIPLSFSSCNWIRVQTNISILRSFHSAIFDKKNCALFFPHPCSGCDVLCVLTFCYHRWYQNHTIVHSSWFIWWKSRFGSTVPYEIILYHIFLKYLYGLWIVRQDIHTGLVFQALVVSWIIFIERG